MFAGGLKAKQEMLRFLRERCLLEEPFVEKYAQLFTDHHITEGEICDLSHELLKEMGVTAVGHRIRILKFAKLFSVPSGITSMTTSPATSPNKANSPLTINQANIPSTEPNLPSTSNPSSNILTSQVEPSKKEEIELSSSEEDDDEEFPSDQANMRRQNDFEGLVLMNHLISSRSTSKASERFTTLISDTNFASSLKKYLKHMFMICQVPPRTHQLKALELIIVDLLKMASSDTPRKEPQNYLFQHSVGSGKSLIMAALVYLLSTLRVKDKPLFDVILVMNDRKQLDMQLWLTISRFLSTHGIFVDSGCRPSSAKELERILGDISRNQNTNESTEPSIVFSTLQKFIRVSSNPEFITCKNRIAIIADEAHRSHGRRSTRLLHDLLVGDTRQSMNITYFSFTSTPTAKALEMFGVSRKQDTKEPFHTYSIAEAIRDGHICNPLSNYITVSTKAIIKPLDNSDDQLHRTNISRAIQHVTRAASSSIELLRSRASFIVKHYIEEIRKKHHSKGYNPKAMVVASSRLGILRYKEALEAEIAKLPLQDQFEVVGAFTPFEHENNFYYEEDVNTKYGVNFLREFQNPASNVQMIIVHSKFLIGFDEPLLHTLYIDRRLHGSALVQALGRICRVAPDKKGCCVVDFVNPRKKVADVFGLYWKKTTLHTFSTFKSEKAKLKRVEDELKGYDCLAKEKSVEDCVAYLRRENTLNPTVIERVLRLMGHYIKLCDTLQLESPGLSTMHLKKIIGVLGDQDRSTTRSFSDKCAEKMQISVQDVAEIATGSIKPSSVRTIKARRSRASKGVPATELATVSSVIHSVAGNFNDTQTELERDVIVPNVPEPEREEASGITKETLEFATGLLRRSHEEPKTPPTPQSPKNLKTGTQKVILLPSPPSSPEQEVYIDIAQHLRKQNTRSHPDSTTPEPQATSTDTKTPSSGSSFMRGPKIVPRIIEISKGFHLLESDLPEEAEQGLTIIQKHVGLADNKVALQNLDLIPKVLTYAKSLYMEPKNEELLETALSILASFSDCEKDVELLMAYGVLPQLNRILRRCSPQLASAGCNLLVRLLEIDESVASSLSNIYPDLMKSIQQHIIDPEASLEQVEKYITMVSKLGKNPLCLQEIYKSGLVDTFFEIVTVETPPTAAMAAGYLQEFAQQNQTIRNHARNNRRLQSKLEEEAKTCPKEKAEAIEKLMRYIWGSINRGRAQNNPRKRMRDSLGRHGPPRKNHRVHGPPKVQSHHSITYQSESNRLTRPGPR